MAGNPTTSPFCGRAPPNETVVPGDVSSKWVFVRDVGNQCYANYLYLWPHVITPIVLILSLLYIRTWGRIDKSPNYRRIFQLTFPLHTLRSCMFLTLMLTQLANFGESLVTDLELQSLLPTQPQLYLPTLLALLASGVAIFYYQKLEVWNKASGLGFLLLYWVWSAATEIIRYINLSKNDGFSFEVMKVIVSCILAAVYIILIAVEFYVYVYKVSYMQCGKV